VAPGEEGGKRIRREEEEGRKRKEQGWKGWVWRRMEREEAEGGNEPSQRLPFLEYPGLHVHKKFSGGGKLVQKCSQSSNPRVHSSISGK
jgi:hypothetical protein